MMGVPYEKVEKIIKPEERLKDLRKSYENKEEIKNPELIKKLIDVADFFHYKANIPYGISGSILPGFT